MDRPNFIYQSVIVYGQAQLYLPEDSWLWTAQLFLPEGSRLWTGPTLFTWV